MRQAVARQGLPRQCLALLGIEIYAFLPMPADPPGAIITDQYSEQGRMMPLWAWVLLIVGGIGFLGALAISAAVFEFTWMKFRPVDRLP